ncbi:hypothetical protein [Frigoribacterium sp. UYMn621]|uniref:hypothetical protein n=1 Tax=Frigoribacterium sp. UYMn621 TaxID=3156343 RepID=UPI00339B593E
MIRAAGDAVATVVKTVQVFLVAGVVLAILSTIPGLPPLTDFTQALAGLHDVAQTAVKTVLDAIPA